MHRANKLFAAEINALHSYVLLCLYVVSIQA